jgi:hypothetical protein
LFALQYGLNLILGYAELPAQTVNFYRGAFFAVALSGIRRRFSAPSKSAKAACEAEIDTMAIERIARVRILRV